MNRNPQVAHELRRIAAENGGILRPADVVQEAADTASPLHPCFEWDDTEAGHLYRLQQARALIRVTVEVQTYQEQSYRVRTYVSLMEDRVLEGGGYRVTTEVLGSPGARARLLEQALREMNTFKIKYQELNELAAVFAAMDRLARSYPDMGPPPLPGEPANDTATL